MFNKERGNVSGIFYVRRCLLLFGILLPMIDNNLISRTLYKKLIFLYQHLDFKESKLSSSYIFSVEYPLIAPGMASVALY